MIMPQCSLQARAVLPALVEGLEDVPQLAFAETVEMGYNRVQLVNHILFLVILQLAAFYADCLGPFFEALIGAGEPTGQGNDPLPKAIIAVETGNREGSQDMVVHTDFDEAARIPVQGNRGEHTQ